MSIDQLNNPTHSNDRIYGKKGLSPCLNTMGGGRRQPKVLVPHLTSKCKKLKATLEKHPMYDGVVKSLDLYNQKAQDISPALQDPCHNDQRLFDGMRVRRLTPTECERLQGYPDGWTKEGVDGPVSDSQRYKCLGNSVTTNVITAIMERIKEIL